MKGYIIVGLICLVIGFFLGLFAMKTHPNNATVGILQNRDSIGFEQVMADTVMKFIETIVYKQSEPKITYIQKIDSIFIEKMKSYNLITKVIKKRNGDMTLFIYNQNDSLLKRIEFENVGQSFEITSQKNNVFVKSNLWDWNGIYFKSRLATPMNENWKKCALLDNGIYTGINFNNSIDLNIGIGYNKETKFNLNLETNIKIK
jgi:hypothetical protein